MRYFLTLPARPCILYSWGIVWTPLAAFSEGAVAQGLAGLDGGGLCGVRKGIEVSLAAPQPHSLSTLTTAATPSDRPYTQSLALRASTANPDREWVLGWTRSPHLSERCAPPKVGAQDRSFLELEHCFASHKDYDGVLKKALHGGSVEGTVHSLVQFIHPVLGAEQGLQGGMTGQGVESDPAHPVWR